MDNSAGYVLVTGASRGLGRCFARTLASSGRDLILVARSADKLASLAAELKRQHGVKVEYFVLDLAERAAGQRLADQILDRNLDVDLLINNAGFGDQGKFLELELERQLDAINLQTVAVVELTYRLLPPMIERSAGGIINISSMAGFQPIPYATVYSAAKAFLTTFSLALEAEVEPFGIAVVTVCPGLMAVADEDVDEQAKPKKFPGGVNKFAAFAERFVPRGQIAKLVKKMSTLPS